MASPLVMDSDSDMDSAPNSPQTHTKKEKKKTNTKFATLESLQQESSSDEEEGELFSNVFCYRLTRLLEMVLMMKLKFNLCVF